MFYDDLSDSELNEKDHLKETIERIDRIFDKDGIIKKYKEDYVPRESQIEASKKIAECLESQGNIILEGPCGFGKTFCYSIPVVNYLLENPRSRAVIVTNGISLQEQLFYKDIPFIQKLEQEIHNKKITYAMLKGKNNFICKNKIENVIFDRSMKGINTPKIIDLYKNENIRNGDISSLNFVPDYDTLSDVACTEEGECIGGGCPYQSECYYKKAKDIALSSRLVITNYHLLFSDLKTGGKILGGYDIVVFDEAHEIQGIHRDFLEQKITENTVLGFRNKFKEAGKADKMIGDIFVDGIDFDWIVNSSKLYFEKIQRTLFYNPGKDGIKMLDGSFQICIYDDAQSEYIKCVKYIQQQCSGICDYCSDKIDTILNSCGGFEELFGEAAEKYNTYAGIANKMGTVSVRCHEIIQFIENYNELAKDPKYASWVENKNGSVVLFCKPTTTADSLACTFFNRTNLSCIVTSATLSVNGNFEYIKEQLGIHKPKDDNPDSKQLIEFMGKSPFDLEKQELWYLPKDAVDGDSKNSRIFQEKLPSQIKDILKETNGGALCLFTSYANLNYASSVIGNELPYARIFKQGDLPRTMLIEKFKNDPDSVLLATRSFFTGVDIPGDSLRCLIIDKFPFPSPGDPVMMKLEKEYGNDMFSKVYIPEMVITLKQAIGRGVRTISDKCVIVVLDGRMSSAGYKGQIFNSFPYQKTGTREIGDIKKFLGIE